MTDLNRLLNSNAFFLGLEGAALVIAATFALFALRQKWLHRLETAFSEFAGHTTLAIAASIGAVIAGRLLLLPFFPVPVPGVHDEYSYLLSGGTFALGRLANPTSPMWKFFESFHILQHPTYVSMYPVAPGLFLALGFLFGMPWLGVLASVALLCGVITWALQGWVPPRWALLGGLIAVLKFGLVSYWIDSYWGGAVPALGGALVVGSVPRLLQRAHVADAISFAAGVLLLANSRPFEGLLFVAAATGWLIVQAVRSGAYQDTQRLSRTILPACVTLLAGVALMAIYFQATTGNPAKMPYVRYSEEYAITQPFLWQGVRPEPVFNHVVMQRYYEREIPQYERIHTAKGWLAESYRKLSAFTMFYLWPGALLTAVTLPRWIKTREGRFALLGIGVVVAGLLIEIWPMMLHYPSPAACAALLLLISALRAVRQFTWRANNIGYALSRAIPVMCVCALSLRIAAAAFSVSVPDHGLVTFLTVAPGNLTRARIIAFLNTRPGKQLVIVRYNPDHDLSHEWVYNSPSISAAHIVWAREMGPSDTTALIHYFPGRAVWLLEPDQNPPVLKPYPVLLAQAANLSVHSR